MRSTRGMADVALVPERDVLHGRERVGAQEPARPVRFSDTMGLRLCGMAELPFWPALEPLLDLAHLGALQVADLHGHLLEGRADQGQARS